MTCNKAGYYRRDEYLPAMIHKTHLATASPHERWMELVTYLALLMRNLRVSPQELAERAGQVGVVEAPAPSRRRRARTERADDPAHGAGAPGTALPMSSEAATVGEPDDARPGAGEASVGGARDSDAALRTEPA